MNSRRRAEKSAGPGPACHRPCATSFAAAAKALERDLTAKLGLKTEIAFDGKGGALTIHYQTLEQLDDLIAKLG